MQKEKMQVVETKLSDNGSVHRPRFYFVLFIVFLRKVGKIGKVYHF